MAALEAGATGEARARPSPGVRQIAAVTAGNALEFYDFLAYAFFAAQIGRSFFPSADPASSLLASLATFGAGFLMRPVGALVIGRIGDRAGRKPAMLLTFALMGVAMLGLALTPSYRQIGQLAPVLAILWRLLQGFALGGEVGPSTAFLAESAPAARRGLYISMQSMSQQLAILAAGVAGLIVSSLLSEEALDAWGWRIPFLLGCAIVPLGLVLRRQLSETLHAPQVAEATSAALPKLSLVAPLGLMMLTGGTVATYVVNFLTTYAGSTLHLPTRIAFLPTVASGLTGAVVYPLSGWLSDRVGRKPMMLSAWTLLVGVCVPTFWLVTHLRTAWALVGAAAVIQALISLTIAPAIAAITELLPARSRCGSLALIYALATSVFGGTTQFAVAWLGKVTGSPLAPAWYMCGFGVVALIAMVLMPETAPAKASRDALTH